MIRVARASGYEVEPIHGIAAQRFVDAADGRGVPELEADMAASVQFLTGGRPSLLQDVMKKRRTEVEYLNGHVSLQAREHGLAVPLNDAVVAEFRRLGLGFTPEPSRLEPLSALLPR